MTLTNHSSNGVALAGSKESLTTPLISFLASELIPMMASFFPKSANQLNSNIQGHAMAYGAMLKGLAKNQIIPVVIDYAERNPDGFAPAPQELKKLCVNSMQEKPSGNWCVSFCSIEMIVFSDCISGRISSDIKSVNRRISILAEKVKRNGGTITGSPGWPPLKALIKKSKE